MTYYTNDLSTRTDGGFWRRMAAGFGAYLERRSRIDRITALHAKTDGELAEMGLTRDRIAHHVFRDLTAI